MELLLQFIPVVNIVQELFGSSATPNLGPIADWLVIVFTNAAALNYIGIPLLNRIVVLTPNDSDNKIVAKLAAGTTWVLDVLLKVASLDPRLLKRIKDVQSRMKGE